MQVLDSRAAPAVDRLVIVADDERKGFGTLCRGIPRQQGQPRVLNGVGVLKLIDQNVPETPSVMSKQAGVVAPQLECPQ